MQNWHSVPAALPPHSALLSGSPTAAVAIKVIDQGDFTHRIYRQNATLECLVSIHNVSSIKTIICDGNHLPSTLEVIVQLTSRIQSCTRVQDRAMLLCSSALWTSSIACTSSIDATSVKYCSRIVSR